MVPCPVHRRLHHGELGRKLHFRQFTPLLLESIGLSTLYVFGFFCVVGIFVSAWLPETKGVPLENVQMLFG